jgi:hypothetical protein
VRALVSHVRSAVPKFLSTRLLGAVVSFGAIALSGCVKKGGEAIVMGKEHVQPMEIVEATDDSATADVSPARDASPAQSGSPRMTEEEWIVSVQMVSNQRWIDVRVDKARWEKLKEGDRVKVTYREGKYTGTAWAAEIR